MKRRLITLASFGLLVALLVGTLSYFGRQNRVENAAGFAKSSSAGPSGIGHETLPDTVNLSTGKSVPEGEGGPAAPAPSESSGFAAAAPTSTTGAAAGVPAVAQSSADLSAGQPYRQVQSDLTAGQVDDNAQFSDYLNYLSAYGGMTGGGTGEGIMPVDVSQRLFVRVLDNSQHPVAGARVQLNDGNRKVFDGTTMSDGRVLFFPSAVGEAQATQYSAVISRGQTSVQATIKQGGPEQVVTLAGLKDNTGAVGVDLVFLLDATGSMGDEIDKIKASVGDIAQRIEQLPGSSAPRFGLVAFRDRGDEFVTRSWDFTQDIGQFSANLSGIQAGGGGDTPESVNAGLHDAIHLPGWADNSTGRHLRMIVLVGDAPPHIDYQNDYRYPDLLQEATANGIKIFPVGASDIDPIGEFVFRQFAEMTQGQFVFLTYANGVSGAPGLSTDMHVSNFSVQNLDTLIVNLVAGEVANQTGQKAGAVDPQPVEAVVPVKAQAVAPAPDKPWLLATIDDFVAGRGDLGLPAWLLLLLLVASVVLSKRKQVMARVASLLQSPEIYLPESSPESDQPARQESASQPTLPLLWHGQPMLWYGQPTTDDRRPLFRTAKRRSRQGTKV